MRWTLVLVAVVIAGAAWFTWRAGDGSRGAERGENGTVAERGPGVAAPAELAPAHVPDEGRAAREERLRGHPRVRGSVRPVGGWPAGDTVELSAEVHGPAGVQATSVHLVVGQDGTFDFEVERGTTHAMLSVESERLHMPAKVRALPGEAVVLEPLWRARATDGEPVDVDPGLVVSGLVLDQYGQPVAGATIYKTDPGSSSWSSSGEHESGPDGRFELTGLERRRWRIGVHSKAAIGDAHVDIEGGNGDVHGLVLTLELGACIAGTVRWPDGTLTGEVHMRVTRSSSTPQGPSSLWKTSTCRSGHFELCGFPDQEYVVQATATRDGESGMSRLEAVRPGGPPLAMVLVPGAAFDLSLTVRDSQGELVPGVRVWASQKDGHSVHANGDGSVTLSGLIPGQWHLNVSAQGFLPESESVDLAPGAAPLAFVLDRAAHIRGTVLDSAGREVAGAWVATGNGWELERAETDAAGRFEVEARLGVTRIHAGKSGHAASEALEVETAQGVPVEGIVLRLREACRLEGRVLDELDQPIGGAWVMAGEFGDDSSTETGDDGAFVLEGLAPGLTSVNAFHESDGKRASARVRLAAGGVSSVELHFRRADPVRVRGLVTRTGQPYAGLLGFLAEAGVSEATCGADGRFDVELTFPGKWNVLVMDERAAAGAEPAFFLAEVEVPDADEHELTLELDTMRRLESLDELPF